MPIPATFMWIWELGSSSNGDLPSIILQLKSAGVSGVIIKAHDGATIWQQFGQAALPLKQAGLSVGAWGYCYGGDVNGEAAAAINAMNNGADFYVIDAEVEYEGKRQQAQEFGTLLRSSLPNALIYYAPFAFPSLHPNFPYQEFSKFCNAVCPQCYWGDIGVSVTECLQRSYNELAQYGLPFAPVGQAFSDNNYTPTDQDFGQFANSAEQLGAQSISFWSYQAATEQMWASIAAISHADPQNWAMPYLGALRSIGVIQSDHFPTELMRFPLACAIFNRTYGFGPADRPYVEEQEIQIAKDAGLIHDDHSVDEIFTWNAVIPMLARAARADGGGDYQQWLLARSIITVDHAASDAVTIGELAVTIVRTRNISV
ncbi:MAG: hypothetical protein JWN30_2329 [Bacilli bacterium]|nr:hypothetical protein [Bacilli bacterium]